MASYSKIYVCRIFNLVGRLCYPSIVPSRSSRSHAQSQVTPEPLHHKTRRINFFFFLINTCFPIRIERSDTTARHWAGSPAADVWKMPIADIGYMHHWCLLHPNQTSSECHRSGKTEADKRNSPNSYAKIFLKLFLVRTGTSISKVTNWSTLLRNTNFFRSKRTGTTLEEANIVGLEGGMRSDFAIPVSIGTPPRNFSLASKAFAQSLIKLSLNYCSRYSNSILVGPRCWMP